MLRRFAIGFTLCACGCAGFLVSRSRAVRAAEQTRPAATIPVPADYREWVYLTSGLDMTYAATQQVQAPPDHDGQFDNVFVNPEAYRTFVRSGTWPDGTTFVLENRSAKRNVSINKGGRTQGPEITGLELHVKQDAEWVFYARQKDGKEHLIAKPASCYTCHEAHAAVDTTFVQFYPTLLPTAQSKAVLSASYLAEEKSAGAK